MVNIQKTIPRMRTVSEAAQEIKELDAQTAITPYHIRRLCLDGIIPTVRAGKKILLNLDLLLEYMANPAADKFKPRAAATASGIQQIAR